MKQGTDKNRKNEKPMTAEEKERRLAISMIRIWAQKYPQDFKRIAEEFKLKTA